MEDSTSGGLNLEDIFKRIRAHPDFPSKAKFDIFFDLFQALRHEIYEPNSVARYKCAFKIVALGNLAKGMGLVPKPPPPKGEPDNDIEGKRIRELLGLTKTEIKFFSTLSSFRNLIADGFYAYDKNTADEIIKSVIVFLQTLFIPPNLISEFKGKFQRISNAEKTSTFMEENPRLEKEKIIKLFKQIKYFFKRSKLFFDLHEVEASAVAYLAGCTSVRNFTYFIRVRGNERNGGKETGGKWTFLECVRFYQDKEYFKNIFEDFHDIEARQRIYFAHVYELQSRDDMEILLQKKIVQEYEKEFLNKLFMKIDAFLEGEYGERDLRYDEDSPRAFEPQSIQLRPKGSMPEPKQGGGREIEQRVEKGVPPVVKEKEREDDRNRGGARERDRDRGGDRVRDRDYGRDRDRGGDRERDRDDGRDRDRGGDRERDRDYGGGREGGDDRDRNRDRREEGRRRGRERDPEEDKEERSRGGPGSSREDERKRRKP